MNDTGRPVTLGIKTTLLDLSGLTHPVSEVNVALKALPQGTELENVAKSYLQTKRNEWDIKYLIWTFDNSLRFKSSLKTLANHLAIRDVNADEVTELFGLENILLPEGVAEVIAEGSGYE